MNDIYHEQLSNGLNVYLYNDSSKHSIYVKYVIKYGGKDVDFKYEGKHYSTKSGIAHFLEHTLLEKSKYGNMMKLLGEKGMKVNGVTSPFYTEYFFNCVKNFSSGLKILINGIDNPVFKETEIDEIRKVILEEERRNLDNKFRVASYIQGINTFKKMRYVKVIGTTEDIENISMRDLMLCYKAFYHPSNKILVIGGNLDIEKTMRLIRSLYKKEDSSSLKLIDVDEPKEVRKIYEKVIMPTGREYIWISFKIDISNYKNDRMFYKYLNIYKELNFRQTTLLHKELIKKGITMEPLDIGHFQYDNYLMFTVGAYTDKKNEFISTIKSNMKNKMDKEYFELIKKVKIASSIRIYENLESCVNELEYNVLDFDYPKINDIDEIKELNFDKLNQIISSLNFDNYTVVEIEDKL